MKADNITIAGEGSKRKTATMFSHLGINEECVLKCCAHIILGIDHAADRRFRIAEQKIGVQKLLNISAGQKAFCSPSTSIHTLGQIALSKLLSPSHAAQSISLYSEYTQWMSQKGILHEGFHGFTANRFGRIAEIAKEYTARRDSILQFFDECVNPNSNKLVLAVSTYIQNDWFHLCTRVYERLGFILIFPLMQLLGIDKAKEVKREDRNWTGVREFFRQKIPELKNIRDNANADNEEELLLSSVLDEVVDTVQRQLEEMRYFYEEESITEETETKLKHAPLTNLGAETKFAKLNNRLMVSGGTTSIDTLSRKDIVATNALLVDSSFTELSSDEKKKRWKWGRASENVKVARKLNKDLLKTIETNKRLALEKKKELKKKNAAKALRTLEKCKDHNGPITTRNIDILQNLTVNELLCEVAYLRNTIAPNIHQMRRVKGEDGKYKMEKFTKEELITGIKNAVQPETEAGHDIKKLLKQVLKK